MAKKTRIKAIYGALEAVSGVAENLVEADWIRAEEISVSPLEGESVEEDVDQAQFGNNPEIQVNSFVKVSFKVAYMGEGNVGVAPLWGFLARACGRDENIIAATSADYELNTNNTDSVTLRAEMDGFYHLLVLGRGEVKVMHDSRAIPYLQFEFTGLWSDPVEEANLVPDPARVAAWPKAKPVNYSNTTALTIFGQTVTLKSLELTQGNDVQHFDDPGEEDVDIMDRKGTGRVSFVAIPISTQNFFKSARENLTGSATITHGTVDGEVTHTSLGLVQLKNPRHGDDSGRLTFEADLRLLRTAPEKNEFLISTSRAAA